MEALRLELQNILPILYINILRSKWKANAFFFLLLTDTPRGYILSLEGDIMSCCEKKDIKIRTDEEKKEITTRINRIIGQLNGVKNMVIENRYCNDVLIQLSAIDKSIKSLANVVLDSHMHTCLIEHIENKDYGIIDEIIDLVKRFQ
jgi:DNA-binding FrmR family transcriptional regulator